MNKNCQLLVNENTMYRTQRKHTYVCLNCFCEFDEPKISIEKHGLENPPYEEIRVCPKCGGDFTDAEYCKNCGAIPIIDGDRFIRILDTGEVYCENCYELI